MKGKFDAYVLWPLAKERVKNLIVDWSTACNFVVYQMEIQKFFGPIVKP